MEERKVPAEMAKVMVALAVVFDVTNMGLTALSFGTLGWMMDLVAALLFNTWLWHYDVHMWSGPLRNVGYSFLAALVAAVPGGAFFFPWTIRVFHATKERRPVAVEQPRRAAPSWRL